LNSPYTPTLQSNPDDITDTNPDDAIPSLPLHKWGALASFVLAAAFIIPPMIHLVGELQTAFGPLTYNLADLLYGPVWAVSLLTSVMALRERIGAQAPRRMLLLLVVAALAAGTMMAIAGIRSSNRHYHLNHPELNLENSTTVLVVWTTLVAGLTAAAWQFWGWMLLLLGWAGWTSRGLPRPLSILYLAGGVAALLVFVQPEMEGLATLLAVIMCIWQGIVLWSNETGGRFAPDAA
jgi:hypothetical protein